MRKGFTLVEMLVVVGIIAVLVAASLGGYTKMTARAERARTQELVSNAATALSAIFQETGSWPQILVRNAGSGAGKLDAQTALAFAGDKTSTNPSEYFSLKRSGNKLSGYDRFGLVTPTAMVTIKRLGENATLGTKVGNSSGTIEDHILRYALDLDGDGIIENVNVGGTPINVRATAIVWCCGKDGVIGSYPYAEGGKVSKEAQDDVYSWTPGQTRNVK